MFELVYHKQFLKQTQKLPEATQRQLRKQLVLLSKNPFDPLLHSKPLGGELESYHSLRIGRDYRVIFEFLNTVSIKLIRIGHRKDIYR